VKAAQLSLILIDCWPVYQ